MARGVANTHRAPIRKKATKISKNNYAQSLTTRVANSKRKVHGKGKEKEVSFDFSNSGTPVPGRVNSFRCDRKAIEESTSISLETLIEPRLGDNHKVRGSFAENIRHAIIKHIGGQVWSESVKYFFDNVLPPIRPEFNIDKIMEQCIKDETLIYDKVSMKYYWEGFSSSSMRSKTRETEVYNKPLKDVFDAITNAASKVVETPEKTCYLHTDGGRATWSLADSDIKPDGHIFLNCTGDTYPEILEGRHWYNVAFTYHFKKSATSVNDKYENIKQMIHSLHHCMVIDPCRRFTLGSTVHGTRTMLWFYSRSTIICSEEFDFCSEPRTMIALVLSLLYASKDELGWDPTIEVKYVEDNDIQCGTIEDKERDGGHQSIVLEIDGKRFKTDSSQVLSDTKANGVYTSATRIYKASRLEDGGEEELVIIKDYWPGDMYDTEDVIRQRIVDEVSDESEKEIVQNYTLTPIASGRVKIGDREDHTKQTILRGNGPSDSYEIALPNRLVGSKSTYRKFGLSGYQKQMDGQTSKIKRKLEENRRKSICHRWHYRIAYREYATPYHMLRSLDDMYVVIVCAVKVLYVIHKAGWIHRDLSPSNLYLYADPISGEKRGLVGDLEFAKKAGTRGRCEIRTCTADFIAVDIMKQTYINTSTKKDAGTGAQKNNTDEYHADLDHTFTLISEKDAISTSDTTAYSQGSWTNYLHDLESIWWILVWTLYNSEYTFETDRMSDGESRDSRSRIREKLFPGTTEYKDRENFLFDETVFVHQLQYAPSHLTALKAFIILFRDLLVSSYEKDGKMGAGPILPTDKDRMHLRILKLFHKTHPLGTPAQTIRRGPESMITECPLKRDTHDTRDDVQRPRKKKSNRPATTISDPTRRVTRSMTRNL